MIHESNHAGLFKILALIVRLDAAEEARLPTPDAAEEARLPTRDAAEEARLPTREEEEATALFILSYLVLAYRTSSSREASDSARHISLLHFFFTCTAEARWNTEVPPSC